MPSKKTRDRLARLRRATASTALYGFTVMLVIGFLMALVSGALGGALILLGALVAASWRIRARRAKSTARTSTPDVEADLDDLQIAGWTIRHDINTPYGVLEHVAASPRDQIAFAISEQPGPLESEHLTEVAQVADWIHHGGVYPGVVPVLLATALEGIETMRGPVLALSPDMLLTALQEAATEAERLNDNPDEPPALATTSPGEAQPALAGDSAQAA